MSKIIDHEHRYTTEERNYLESRGQRYLIEQNERIYGAPGDKGFPDEPGRDPGSLNAKNAVKEQRKADSEQAKTVEGKPYVDPAPRPQPSGDELDSEDSLDAYGEGLDDDIVAYAESFTVADLKVALDKEKVEFDVKAKKGELAEVYANVLQDKRDAGETVNTTAD